MTGSCNDQEIARLAGRLGDRLLRERRLLVFGFLPTAAYMANPLERDFPGRNCRIKSPG